MSRFIPIFLLAIVACSDGSTPEGSACVMPAIDGHKSRGPGGVYNEDCYSTSTEEGVVYVNYEPCCDRWYGESSTYLAGDVDEVFCSCP